MEIKEVFSAEPKSTWHILCESNTGFYVPAYQREYSWNKDNINRLVDDTCHGIRLLLDNNDAITFIGTLIYIHDIRHQTVNPIVKPEVPGKVCVVIDGQQRLTTLLLINTIIHNDLLVLNKRFKNSDKNEDTWLFQKALSTISQLGKTFEFDMDYGNSRWYPRMIRAYDDSWSRNLGEAKYTSPIARYLNTYGTHGRADDTKEIAFKYELTGIPDDIINKHEIIKDNIKEIKKCLKEIYKDTGSDFDFPKITEIIYSKQHFKDLLIGPEIPEYVKSILLNESNERYYTEYRSLFRLIVFAKYLLERIAVTIVGAKNESYAFDMFESLNTTGEPLTAYETFKPNVINSEGLAQYEKSESKLHMGYVEDYLNLYKKAQDKHDATSELVIPFALAENGIKMSKRLSDQRRYLKDKYDTYKDIDEKRMMVRHFGHAALVIKHSWPDDISGKPSIYQVDSIDDETILCLDVLRAANHNIVLGFLFRYFSEIRLAQAGDEKEAAIKNFEKATKAITAFSIIWRLSRKSTGGIDSIYREIMKAGVDALNIEPFCRSSIADIAIKYNKLPDADKLVLALKYFLKSSNHGDIKDKSDWTNKSKCMPLYLINRPITRFILLAASHDSCLDKSIPGLIKYGREGLLSTLCYSEWSKLKRDEDDYTVEHVAPKTPDNISSWDKNIYDDKNNVNMIGNLVLLPRIENAIASNKEWKIKKLVYEMCSAETADELDIKISEGKSVGIELPESTLNKLRSSKYNNHVAAISKLSTPWRSV